MQNTFTAETEIILSPGRPYPDAKVTCKPDHYSTAAFKIIANHCIIFIFFSVLNTFLYDPLVEWKKDMRKSANNELSSEV